MRCATSFDVDLRPVGRLQHAQVIQFVGGDIVAREDLRAAEKIALEIGVAHAERALEIVVGFHLFGQQPHARAGAIAGQPELLLDGRGEHIHLDEIGQRHQRPPCRRVAKIVEGDQVAHLLQPAAGGDDLLVHVDGFQNLEDDAVFRQQRGIVADQKIPRAVHETRGGPA